MPEKSSFDWDQPRIREIFRFLEANSQWNRKFQERAFRRCLACCRTDRMRLTHFLHLNVSTQSGPDMDELMPFWQGLHSAKRGQVATLRSFTRFVDDLARPGLGREGSKKQERSDLRRLRTTDLSDAPAGPWEDLFEALRVNKGWGPKTAALFVKAAIQLHRGPPEFHFWKDGAAHARTVADSKIHLPVDRAILFVFQTLGHRSPSFANINKGLMSVYTPEQMLRWDDLWFWGFYTQTGSGSERTLGWNSGKFWSQLSTSKKDEDVLKVLGSKFVHILEKACSPIS